MQLLLRRLAGGAALFWLVVTLVFVLVRLAPGDPSLFLVPPGASHAEVVRARAVLGLDAPLPVQYARWAGGLLKGDLGESFALRRPVARVLADAAPASVALGALSLMLTFAVGVSVGMAQALRRGRAADTALTIVTTAVYAAPTYWLGLALVAAFTYGAAVWGFPPWLRLPAFGMTDPAAELHGVAAAADVARHAMLPVAVLSAVGAAGIARYARSSAADVLDADFMRAARAKGLGPVRLYGRHALRNMLPPLVVLFALSLPGLIAGSVFVESVFAWPGMGRTMVGAIGARDYPVVLGATILYAGAVIIANLAADVAVGALDPRRAG